MSSAGFALQKALYAALVSATTVTSAIGGPRIYDDVPRGVAYPYVTFGNSTERDWSTGTETGSEHIVTLHVWSKAAGRKEADVILAAIRATLHDQPLTLTGHHLVNLRIEFMDALRQDEDETWHGLLRLRAVTEVIGP